MPPLTRDEVLYILTLIGEKEGPGYAEGLPGLLQVKLSIYLQMLSMTLPPP